LGAANGHLGMVVARYQLYEVECAGTSDHDLAHVRDVEEPGAVPYRLVFLDQARVLHWQLETCELHHSAPGRHVLVKKRRFLDLIGLVHWAASSLSTSVGRVPFRVVVFPIGNIIQTARRRPCDVS